MFDQSLCRREVLLLLMFSSDIVLLHFPSAVQLDLGTMRKVRRQICEEITVVSSEFSVSETVNYLLVHVFTHVDN